MTTLSRYIWRKYRWFGLVWIIFTGLAVYILHTAADRERVCAYQYCPSPLVIAAAVGCIVLSMAWIEFFFSFLRPLLKRYIGRWLGTEIINADGQVTLLELLILQKIIDPGNEFWSAAPDASWWQRFLVACCDILVFLLFLVLPTSVLIAGASLAAYLEQSQLP